MSRSGRSSHGGRPRGSSRSGRRRSYHHGDLAEAMVHAALGLITEFGPSGFSFAEVTRIVGVSPAAPYRHFRDRDALVAHIAEKGFDLLAAKLAKAWNKGAPDTSKAFQSLGQAYLTFAAKEPAYYAAMFNAHFPDDLMTDVRKASDGAFAVLREATEVLLEKVPKEKRPPALMVSLHVWSMTHGIVSLYGAGHSPRHMIPMEPGDLLEAGLLVYLEGLGLSWHDAPN